MKAFFLKIWKDPVWSKVISAGIIGAVVWAWKLIDTDSFAVFWDFIVSVFNYMVSIPIWGIILIICIRWGIIRIIRSLRKGPYVSPVWNETVGNYTFSALYEDLTKLKAVERTARMIESSIAPHNDSLATLFWIYRDNFNAGVSNKIVYSGWDDGGYLAEIVGPKLLAFGLVEQIEDKGYAYNSYYSYLKYVTSEIGFKYLECCERLENESLGLR